MATGFVGRTRELAVLQRRLDRVRDQGNGVALTLRGRRQVGKSRLVQEFCDRAQVPYLFFTATKGAPAPASVTAFLGELRDSPLPVDRELVPAGAAAGWSDALRALASVLPATPSIVVLDEVPWLSEQDMTFDGSLQVAWDRLLSRRPVLLLLLGSDLHMMERLTAYDRPFFGRADSMVLGPLNPAEVGAATGLDAADAIDAHLITGGLPGIVRTWPEGTPPAAFLGQASEDPASPLFSVPESVLLAEFPAPDLSRRVLEAVGSGERTHARIAAAAGSGLGAVPSGSLSPILQRLTQGKRVLHVEEPLSTVPGKPALYRIADSNLRFYLAIGRAVQEQARRGLPEAGVRLVRRRWGSWCGRAVEPLVREALARAAISGTLPWSEVEVVGGWWNRQFDPEIDLVGADRMPVARQIDLVGSVKWLQTPFDSHDLARLVATAPQVPGFAPGRTGLVAVTLSGVQQNLSTEELAVVWGPQDVVGAWAD